MDRRTFLTAGATFALLAVVPALAAQPARRMLVMKDPNCGCCEAWAEIARRHGFDVEVEVVEDMAALKDGLGIPAEARSCHTARLEGYVLEGHVPMEAVDKLLRERPEVTGIAVPGMPMGSPGMGDDPKARYDVLAFGGSDGGTSVFFRAGEATI